MDNKLIARINELYKKQKTIGLTPQEAAEQQELRRKYIRIFRQNLKAQLENIRFVDKD